MNLQKINFRTGVIAVVIASLFLVCISPSANAGPSTILGTTGANPQSITIDSSGNIYAANSTSNNVSKITPAGVSTILGTTGTGPGKITIDSSGNIYTANRSSDNVSKITPAGVSTILGTTGEGPNSITIDSSGNIYTANLFSNNVSKIMALDAPAFTLSSSSGSANAGSVISSYTVNSTGGTIASYSISPAIGNGLSFNTTTGLISGTPTAEASAVTYTITATNTSGTATATYSLTINADPVIAANAEAARVAAANAEAARVAAANAEAARVAAANTEAARKQKVQQELTEIFAIIPKIAELTLSLGELTKAIVMKKSVVSDLAKNQPIKVTASELKQIQKLGKTLALKIAESNKGSVNEGAVASFAEGVRILYGK